MNIPEFKPGLEKLSANHLNMIVKFINGLVYGEFISVTKIPGGNQQVDLNLARLLPRIPKVQIPLFIAKMTAQNNGVYAWTEQSIKDDGTFEDKPADIDGRSGTVTENAAKELNAISGLYDVGEEFYIEMWELISPNGTKFYRFGMVFPPFADEQYAMPTYNSLKDTTKGRAVVEIHRIH